MRNWFHSIGARIFAGFGLFIAALAVFFVLTARTTKTQSRLLEEAVALDIAKADVAKLLQSVEAMRAYSLWWPYCPSRSVSMWTRTSPSTSTNWIRRQTQRTQEPVTRTGGSPPTALSPSPYHRRPARPSAGPRPTRTRKTDFDADFDTMVRVDEILDNPLTRAKTRDPAQTPSKLGCRPWEPLRAGRPDHRRRGGVQRTPIGCPRPVDFVVRAARRPRHRRGCDPCNPPTAEEGPRAVDVLARGVDHPFPMSARKDEIGEMAKP